MKDGPPPAAVRVTSSSLSGECACGRYIIGRDASHCRVATAHNQEQGTKNQEQPRSGFQLKKPPPFKRRGFLWPQHGQLRTKNSRVATPLLQLKLFTSTTAAGGDPPLFT
jgi:hypothetical protein